jgi:hypothetical protein
MSRAHKEQRAKASKCMLLSGHPGLVFRLFMLLALMQNPNLTIVETKSWSAVFLVFVQHMSVGAICT